MVSDGNRVVVAHRRQWKKEVCIELFIIYIYFLNYGNLSVGKIPRYLVLCQQRLLLTRRWLLFLFSCFPGSFIVFRILLTIGLDYWAVSNRHRLPGAISAVLIFSFIVFTVMNFVLFFRVLASEKRILNEYNKRHMTNQPYSNGTVSCWDSSVKKTKTKWFTSLLLSSFTFLISAGQFDFRFGPEEGRNQRNP